MADDILSLEVAGKLALKLKGIPGFSWDEEVIQATAEDLVRWCKGAIINNRVWPAEAQADWIVHEVRMRSVKSWIGPGAMYQIFRQQFDPPKLLGRENQLVDLGPKPVIACSHCNDFGMVNGANGEDFCFCAQGDVMRVDYAAKGWTPRRQKPALKLMGPSVSPETLVAIARATLDDPLATKAEKNAAETTLQLNRVEGGEYTEEEPS